MRRRSISKRVPFHTANAWPARSRTATASGSSLPLVVLDPGHGGKDPGTIGAAGTLEKRITLAAALELKRQLEAGGRCRVALTRGRDVFVSLDGRVELARKRQAALFEASDIAVELHPYVLSE